ncbi:hypothetical protein PSHT_02859 [Puccinia striiformis]|uniref:Uncharacterized protein n=2 Tax=Puccinia striiformis TaxID=27350 RepID=A0A0L0UUM7_9BASI|nr:hypothetical protein H4Q26_014779 [Puccinia striiformis f. sp. tritici PST-130]KNE90747.1 hypothetical protein PSTG_15811 [Puccinia striiformis f. sp. tritici PST-78]POW21097.1 hypothetical protein PSHT_02859 [Puccinia striiformis]
MSTSKLAGHEQRLDLFKRCSPFYRTRTEVLWGANEYYPHNQTAPPEIVVICIRAVGPRAKVTEGSDEALIDALGSKKITPVLLYKVEQDHEWPNHWLVHIPVAESNLLPHSLDSNGVFWNTKDDPMFFIWCLRPITSSEFDNYRSCEVKWNVYIPPVNQPDGDLTKKMCLQGLQISDTTKSQHVHLTVKKAKMSISEIGGVRMKNGKIIVYTEYIPPQDFMQRYVCNKSWRRLQGNSGATQLSLELMGSCHSCGAEYHQGDCPLERTIQDLIPQMDSLRAITIDEELEVYVVKRPAKARGKPIEKPTQTPKTQRRPSKPYDRRTSQSFWVQ